MTMASGLELRDRRLPAQRYMGPTSFADTAERRATADRRNAGQRTTTRTIGLVFLAYDAVPVTTARHR
jgi:hypothetical protein